MRDTKNRLCKLLNECQTFAEFRAAAIHKASWVLSPYVQAGHIVNSPWLVEFWDSHKKQVTNQK